MFTALQAFSFESNRQTWQKPANERLVEMRLISGFIFRFGAASQGNHLLRDPVSGSIVTILPGIVQ
ncbi:MAG: hypothetical protein CMQ17_11285 [Gammaproteobacteria bacterium]|nr:hypothetical protein [Gammaproteobacteria bacterium]